MQCTSILYKYLLEVTKQLKSVRVHLAPGSKAVKTVYTSTRHNWNVKNICGERSTRKLAPAHDVYTTSAND